MRLRLTYESTPGHLTVWEKDADELLVPNGEEPLIAWMLRTAAERDSETFTLEVIRPFVAPPSPARRERIQRLLLLCDHRRVALATARMYVEHYSVEGVLLDAEIQRIDDRIDAIEKASGFYL